MFPEERHRKEFQSHLAQVLSVLNESTPRLEAEGRWEHAFRQRWFAAGLSSLQLPLVPSRWQPADAVLQPRRASGAAKGSHPVTQWPASTYQRIQTPHFENRLASQCKRHGDGCGVVRIVSGVMAAVFFPIWATDDPQTQRNFN